MTVKGQDRPGAGETKPKGGGSERRSTRRRTAAAAAPGEKRRTPADRKLEEGISSLYQGVALVVMGTASGAEDFAAGAHIAEQAPVIASAWMDLGDQNPAIKAALKRFTEGTAFATIIGLHATTFLPLLAAKGLVPERIGQIVAMQAGMGAAAAQGAAAAGGAA